ncbi:hypothetical protein AB833_16805 [Chromatiales bacterium (ex Bugula neritina AB1)]|nr:hypothetical protein AB833_16805 [Chromatiales bacterium (ex Bugula neritina AB1)]
MLFLFCSVLLLPRFPLPEYALDWILRTEGLLQSSDLPDSLLQSANLPPAVEASVLVPLFQMDGEWHLLFIRRVSNARDRHSGQVAFPGGRRDPADKDAIGVALREAHEEVGLSMRDINVFGELDVYRTSSNFIVTPVVAQVPWPYPFKPQLTEVDRIFSIPLLWLADPANHELRDRPIKADSTANPGSAKVVYFSSYDGEMLWGATARMTLSLLKSLHEGDIKLHES